MTYSESPLNPDGASMDLVGNVGDIPDPSYVKNAFSGAPADPVPSVILKVSNGGGVPNGISQYAVIPYFDGSGGTQINTYTQNFEDVYFAVPLTNIPNTSDWEFGCVVGWWDNDDQNNRYTSTQYFTVHIEMPKFFLSFTTDDWATQSYAQPQAVIDDQTTAFIVRVNRFGNWPEAMSHVTFTEKGRTNQGDPYNADALIDGTAWEFGYATDWAGKAGTIFDHAGNNATIAAIIYAQPVDEASPLAPAVQYTTPATAWHQEVTPDELFFHIYYGVGDPETADWLDTPLTLNEGDAISLKITHTGGYAPVPESIVVDWVGLGGDMGNVGNAPATDTLLTDNVYIHDGSGSPINSTGISNLDGSFKAIIRVTLDGVETPYDTENTITCTAGGGGAVDPAFTLTWGTSAAEEGWAGNLTPITLHTGDDLFLRVDRDGDYSATPSSVVVTLIGEQGEAGILDGGATSLITDTTFINAQSGFTLSGIQILATGFHCKVSVTIDGVTTDYDTNTIACTSISSGWTDTSGVGDPIALAPAGFTLTALAGVEGGISVRISADDEDAIFPASLVSHMQVLYGPAAGTDIAAALGDIGVCTMYDGDGVYQGPQTFTLLDTLTDPVHQLFGTGDFHARVAISDNLAVWHKTGFLNSSVTVPVTGVVMPVLPKRTLTSGRVPTTEDIVLGELAVDVVTGKMYVRLIDDSIFHLNASAEGGTVLAANITDATTLGRAVLQAADAAEALAALGAASTTDVGDALTAAFGAADTADAASATAISASNAVSTLSSTYSAFLAGSYATTQAAVAALTSALSGFVAASITDSTTVGRALVKAADAAAARSAISAASSSAVSTAQSTADSAASAAATAIAAAAAAQATADHADSVQAADITDATSVGKNVLKATDGDAALQAQGTTTIGLALAKASSAAAARAAIGTASLEQMAGYAIALG